MKKKIKKAMITNDIIRTNVMIGEQHREKAIRIGGDISKGIRKALDKYEEKQANDLLKLRGR
jgi:hypothetical protein